MHDPTRRQHKQLNIGKVEMYPERGAIHVLSANLVHHSLLLGDDPGLAPIVLICIVLDKSSLELASGDLALE